VSRSGTGAIIGAGLGIAVWVFGRLTGVGRSVSTVSRRNFVRNATLGAILIVLGQLTFGFLRFFWPNKTGAFGSVLTVSASNVPVVGDPPYRNTAGKFYLMRNEDGLLALYWKCTHLGCTVPWNAGEDRFHCPCHGSIFFRNGVKESGPAPRPMDLFPIEVSPAGDVLVDTGNPISRGDYDPSQAVPYPA
jgi:cytochrome b6-f complex iron-sulfur subunit